MFFSCTVDLYDWNASSTTDAKSRVFIKLNSKIVILKANFKQRRIEKKCNGTLVSVTKRAQIITQSATTSLISNNCWHGKGKRHHFSLAANPQQQVAVLLPFPAIIWIYPLLSFQMAWCNHMRSYVTHTVHCSHTSNPKCKTLYPGSSYSSPDDLVVLIIN